MRNEILETLLGALGYDDWYPIDSRNSEMKEVIKIFEKIKNTSSTNAKQTIIFNSKDNDLFKTCLKFLLDGSFVTGISDKKIHKSVGPESEMAPYYLCQSSSFPQVINYLKKNNTGRDCDIYEIQCFLKGHEEDREFYEQMICKTYRLGVSDKIVNKAIPRLIPQYNVQLGTPIEKCKLTPGEMIFISQKLNGTRMSYINGKLMTRQNKEYIGLNHIISDIEKLGLHDMFVDGELRYKNAEGLSDSEAFQKGTGIAMSKTGDKTQLKFIVFDMIPSYEFWAGKSKKKYSARKKQLLDLKAEIAEQNIDNIEVVDMVYEGTDHSQIWKWLQYAEDNDWEGVMINCDTPYECKRTTKLCKVKRFYECDIRCTGVEEGSGRNKDTLGAIVCSYKGFELKVGSGFTDADRSHYWEKPSDIIGKIVTIKYKEETANKNGTISVQFPIFQGVRFDKNEESYN